jgi:OmcA/MtrC family decaheme c-type cytochrome
VEIGVMPRLENPALPSGDNVVALDAPSRTFDLGADAFDDDFYPAIVKVPTGCNNCHDALGTTFHSADRGGNIVICRLCHTTRSGGSHLEMQSRSIDSYIHAIHSFQAFDIGRALTNGGTDFNDPVEAMRYEHHINSHFPTFGINNCESCHVAGKYNVPDQSKSLPGILSASWPTLVGWDRNIGVVPSYVTGPASRACGACHRVEWINEDDPVSLASFNSHTATNGYLLKNTDSTVLDNAINTIFSAEYFGSMATP